MLSVEGLSIGFQSQDGVVPTVQNVSFNLSAGEVLGLVGESGSGKTLTSLGVIGLLPPNASVTAGRVVFEGVDLLSLNQAEMRKLRGRRISMIFQDPVASLDPVFTCGDQIIEAIQLHEKIGRGEAYRRAVALLEREHVKDPARVMRSYPHELSGGQCQRIMIAMAVASRPQLIIADEPTTALDVTVQRQVLDILERLNEEVGAAILLITHDLGVVYEIADRVIVMNGGRLLEEATRDEIFRRPQHDYTKALLDAMPALGKRRDRLPVIERGGATDAPRAMASAAPPAPREPGPPILEVRDLSKTFLIKSGMLAQTQRYQAVDNVSLSIARHTTLGLVGESGCGKTSLSRLIMRLTEPDSGQILFNGTDIAQLSERRLFPVRRNIAMVFQNPFGSLNPRLSVQEAISAPMQIHGGVADRPRRVADLLDAVGLPRNAGQKYPHEFSGGQRQRIAIARALALNPSLVICDEAVSALDVSVQAQVLNLLKDLQAEFALTYLFISHDLSVVEHISDTIAVMRAGRIVETGPADAIFAAPQEEYTRILLAAVPRIGIEREDRQERLQ
ncbi:ABC transporter ATP-binding protein [Arsenicitalea aurantiaca]|uniref:ABC transporter ATP-binding protein n=1 Tax=Arsenicitalea aurantiaca TaxID=1783274 RepID=UPI00195CC799|nr:ABC transporter ATP-binding protein [Arsenicitalea aurantiaca]